MLESSMDLLLNDLLNYSFGIISIRLDLRAISIFDGLSTGGEFCTWLDYPIPDNGKELLYYF